MADISNLPKWATPDRQEHLVKLWAIYGNKCLLGHPTCPDPSHYIQDNPKVVYVGKSVKLPCQDRQGNPIRDDEGNQLYLTLYHPVPSVIHNLTACRLYDIKAEEAITDWKKQDRLQRQAEWIAEQKAIHNLGEQTYPLRGQFSSISKEIWGSNQPLFYVQGLAISGLTLKPFAKVRLSSSYMRLYVDLGNALRRVSKSRRRKAIRYGKPLPKQVEESVILIVREAVKDYLAH